MPVPQLSLNDVIEVFQWRTGNGHTFVAVVESEVKTDDEDDPCVDYKTVPTAGSIDSAEEDGLYHHHAVWDEDSQRWEDGDI